ncbi:hypothetical protein B0T10DRAFT_602193 [Thelonectria olida]|uniref:Phosphorylase n=1 Tax=Thelonectria olida TaxID=1576542 RepID=A0A9P8WFY1_9HYPO|nr:hypothetical protein B0T10DRAFT_602193 [Thelonectria olida]
MSSNVDSIALDEAALTERFDQLVKDGVIFYDPDPKVIPCEDGGYKFEFQITHALKNKPGIPSSPPAHQVAPSSIPGSDINVSGFEIQPIGATHLLAYNMFSGFRPHFLLLTQNGHRKQHEPLDMDDIQALYVVLSAMKGEYMALYNCGEDSGCSRSHKHMQLIPHATATFDVWRNIMAQGPNMPYQSFVGTFPSGLPEPQELLCIYLELFQQAQNALGQSVSEGNRAPPHNVIFDRNGIMVIPRRAAGISRAGANAAGMLGVLWMSSEARAQEWMDLGPVNVLKAAGVPETSGD